jgi:hypothetical protein
MNTSCAKKQRGIASFIVVLLAGLSLTVMTLGMVSTINGAQDSVNTVHAQTQAEMMAASGYQALASYLSNKTQAELNSITKGVISTTPSISYVKNTADCPASGVAGEPNYCFDVTATKSSGGTSIATSTVRALFKSVKTITTSTSSNSVFAGGLAITGNTKFIGDLSRPITLELKMGDVDVSGNAAIEGFTYMNYTPRSFIKAADLRGYANYIFYIDASSVAKMCENNMNGSVVESNCTTSLPSFVLYANGAWNITAADAPPGVLWFGGNAVLTLAVDNSIYANSLASSILVTGNMIVKDSGQNKTFDAYSASFFKSIIAPLGIDPLLISNKICSFSSAKRPNQYCDSNGALKDTTSFPAALANILFLVDGLLTLDNSANSIFNLNGNVISNRLVMGTGNPSGNTRGNGVFNIIGNIAVTGDYLTSIAGNINFDLSRASNSLNSIPSISYTSTLKNIKYQ